MTLDKESYIAHIKNRQDIINMRQILDKIEIVLKKHNDQWTDFLNPYERRLAKSILNRFDEISYKENGGISESERKIISIYPSYREQKQAQNPITALKIQGSFSKLSHKDFLGSILGLGINRDKIGDILIHDNYVQIIVKNEISSFISMNLKKIGNINVDIKEMLVEDLSLGKTDYKEVSTVIPSLRLDTLVSGAWNLSRNDSKRLIESGKTKVNWEPVEKVFKDIEEGDLISAKGYGRFTLDSIGGMTRKGNTKVKLKLLK